MIFLQPFVLYCLQMTAFFFCYSLVSMDTRKINYEWIYYGYIIYFYNFFLPAQNLIFFPYPVFISMLHCFLLTVVYHDIEKPKKKLFFLRWIVFTLTASWPFFLFRYLICSFKIAIITYCIAFIIFYYASIDYDICRKLINLLFYTSATMLILQQIVDINSYHIPYNISPILTIILGILLLLYFFYLFFPLLDSIIFNPNYIFKEKTVYSRIKKKKTIIFLTSYFLILHSLPLAVFLFLYQWLAIIALYIYIVCKDKKNYITQITRYILYFIGIVVTVYLDLTLIYCSQLFVVLIELLWNYRGYIRRSIVLSIDDFVIPYIQGLQNLSFFAFSWNLFYLFDSGYLESNKYYFWLCLVGITLSILLFMDCYFLPKKKIDKYKLISLIYLFPFQSTIYLFHYYYNPIVWIYYLTSLMLLQSSFIYFTFAYIWAIGSYLAYLISIYCNSLQYTEDARIIILSSIFGLFFIIKNCKNKNEYIKTKIKEGYLIFFFSGHEIRNNLVYFYIAFYKIKNVLQNIKSLEKKQFYKKENYLLLKNKINILDEASESIKIGLEKNERTLHIFSHMIERGSNEKELKQLSMIELCKKVIFMLPEQYKKIVVFKEEEDMICYCNEDHFYHVLLNLVKNSSIHGKATKVTLKILPLKRILVIQDNGKGMDPQLASLLFSSSNLPKSKDKGWSIGLQLVKSFVCNWKSEISSFSKRDSFTRTEIKFPTLKEYEQDD